MNNLITHPDYHLYERKGEPFCSSIQVAETFGKRHDNVLRDIRATIEACPPDFGLLNFEESSYKNEQGKRQPMYLLTKDGFTMLTMGYTGKKAMRFKVEYIRRFNEMESFIKSLVSIRDEHPAFTEAVMLAHDEPKHYHFSNEIDMINRIVLGQPAKAIRGELGLSKGASIRPFLSHRQISDIKALQMADVGLLATMPVFASRKLALETLHIKRAARLLN